MISNNFFFANMTNTVEFRKSCIIPEELVGHNSIEFKFVLHSLFDNHLKVDIFVLKPPLMEMKYPILSKTERRKRTIDLSEDTDAVDYNELKKIYTRFESDALDHLITPNIQSFIPSQCEKASSSPYTQNTKSLNLHLQFNSNDTEGIFDLLSDSFKKSNDSNSDNNNFLFHGKNNSLSELNSNVISLLHSNFTDRYINTKESNSDYLEEMTSNKIIDNTWEYNSSLVEYIPNNQIRSKEDSIISLPIKNLYPCYKILCHNSNLKNNYNIRFANNNSDCNTKENIDIAEKIIDYEEYNNSSINFADSNKLDKIIETHLIENAELYENEDCSDLQPCSAGQILTKADN